MLVCPITKQPLRHTQIIDAERDGSGAFTPCARSGSASSAVGRTPEVMLREDGLAAYPVIGGIPVLLGPEMLARDAAQRTFDLQHPHYAEAYQEMEFYNESAHDAGE